MLKVIPDEKLARAIRSRKRKVKVVNVITEGEPEEYKNMMVPLEIIYRNYLGEGDVLILHLLPFSTGRVLFRYLYTFFHDQIWSAFLQTIALEYSDKSDKEHSRDDHD